MKVVLGGARGSFSVSRADKVRYGGSTFSLLVEGREGGQVLIDAGTGVRQLRSRVRAGGTLFFTHTHLDHLTGLPMLAKVWPQRMILPRGGLEEVLESVFSSPIWPVKLAPTDFPVPPSPLEVDGLQVSWQAIAHPDGCVSYRIDELGSGASVVVATDIEWPVMTSRAQDEFARFAHGTDLLVFDAHYLPSEYAAHKGWGHSTWTDAVDAAHRCGAPTLWLVHHAPSRTDAELDAMTAEAAATFNGTVLSATETMMEALHE